MSSRPRAPKARASPVPNRHGAGSRQGSPFPWSLLPARRISTPEIRQAESAECGLAALAIILAHFDTPVPLEDLRTAAGSTRLGSAARTLLSLARPHGLEARAFRKEPEDLPALGFPLIVHSRFIHFLVVEGMTATHALVNDSAGGPHDIPLEEFAEDFTGIVLTFRSLKTTLRQSGRGWCDGKRCGGWPPTRAGWR